MFPRRGSGQFHCLRLSAVEDIDISFNRAEGTIQRRDDGTRLGNSLFVFERFRLQPIGPSNQIKPKSLGSKLNHFTTPAFPGCLTALKGLL